ncbi:MAG: DNA integrity scanning protein DisA nucleotide-binding domain protein [Vicinamibacterales bacterium]
MFDQITRQIDWLRPDVVVATIELAVEIAREGREGRRIGTLFTLGDADAVLRTSRPLILDPLAGHTPSGTHIADPDLRGTIKELAQLDGAFIVADDGTVVAACRYLDASGDEIDLPLGLGSRHLAGASVSRRSRALAVVVSESGVVRIFWGGRLLATIIPELWLISRLRRQFEGALDADRLENLAIIFPSDRDHPA